MPRKRITIETVDCRRCGREIAAASRSVLGLDSLKETYGGICGDCITPDEKSKINHEILSGVLHKMT